MKILFLSVILVSFILSGCTNRIKATKQSHNNNKTLDTLSDADSNSVTNKYWKLITLNGASVTMAKNQERETFFILKTENTRVTGFSGCNVFNGSYTLEDGWRIRFSPMASTMMACPDVEVNEIDFLKIFELTDNYTIREDTLSLNVGRRAPLAVFVEVNFE